jgi:hypothetical protein
MTEQEWREVHVNERHRQRERGGEREGEGEAG